MNAMEKVVDLLLCIGLIFLMPLLYFDSQRCTSQAILAGQMAESFLGRVSVEGELTEQTWEQLERTLWGLGCKQYEIQREYCLYEPGEDGTVLESVHRLETEDIRGELETKGYVRLRKGDTVRILLYCNEIPAMYSTVIRTGGEFQ